MRAIGIILAGGKRSTLGVLTKQRNLAAMPVGGSYRAIDFALSNLSNSGIKKVAVISQYSARSLADHIGSSKWWDFGRKKTGLFLFTPHMINQDGFGFRGTADSIFQNIEFLKKSNEPYVVITSGEQIYRLDYEKIIKYHEQKDADITIVCKDLQTYAVEDYGVIGLDEDNKMIEFEEKPLNPQYTTVSLGIYVISRELLIKLLEELELEGRYSIVNDIIVRYRKKLKMYGYLFEGYWKRIRDINEFYKINMDFLTPEVRKLFFNTYPSISTKAKDEPPAKFNAEAKVTNSIISGGDIINGQIENSVLFRKVFVGEGTIVKDSIIMEGATIGKGCIIENAILDKQVFVSDGQKVIGTKDKIILLEKRNIV
ncbi:glucose-1-phosphate adenylyltransferase subunit GlgD [Cellulosilyticum sp. I15G10I2]|uniref:glucose-1-phosphate adenylyltransferase subunit GlgD n=1 Tax=Cellulosilyticum sp. I15G10I2 TaxID=1892843 RepID=UPI00085BCC38|nr:glucose-1-phosphate adenylyltransferase subunit GlgD [Cellulosilyticum sp. I15G10I2]